MPDARRLASSAFISIAELRAWPRRELVQLYYGCTPLHGTLDGLVYQPRNADFIEDIRTRAAENLHVARYYLLHPHDMSTVVHKLYLRFKCCFFAVQSWMLLRDGKYVARKDDLLDVLLDAHDREAIRVARDWGELEQDRGARPLYYVQLLERWSRSMLLRIAAYEDSQHNKLSCVDGAKEGGC